MSVLPLCRTPQPPPGCSAGVRQHLEMMILFVRDESCAQYGEGRPEVHAVPAHDIFYILIMNLFGLIPYGASATRQCECHAGLAISFVMIQTVGNPGAGCGTLPCPP